jgi:hypothetical protein
MEPSIRHLVRQLRATKSQHLYTHNNQVSVCPLEPPESSQQRITEKKTVNTKKKNPTAEKDLESSRFFCLVNWALETRCLNNGTQSSLAAILNNFLPRQGQNFRFVSDTTGNTERMLSAPCVYEVMETSFLSHRRNLHTLLC